MKKKFRIILLILLVTIMVTSILYLIDYYRKTNNDNEMFKSLEQVETNKNESESSSFEEDSKLSNNDANDLVIKLVEMSECHEEYAKDLPKHVMRDNFYADIKDMMMTDKIIGAFSIDNNCSKVLKEMISKIHPAHVSDGEAYSLQRVAYEIADKFKLPVGAEEKIVKSMQEIQSAPEKEADAYFIKRLSNASAEYDSLSEGI